VPDWTWSRGRQQSTSSRLETAAAARLTTNCGVPATLRPSPPDRQLRPHASSSRRLTHVERLGDDRYTAFDSWSGKVSTLGGAAGGGVSAEPQDQWRAQCKIQPVL